MTYKTISKREEAIFRNEYNKWLRGLCNELNDYRETMIEVMRGQKLKHHKDDDAFKDTAKHAMFHKILNFYHQEANVEEVNSIINNSE